MNKKVLQSAVTKSMIVVGLLLLIVGCGSNNATSSPSASASSSGSASAAPAAANLLEKIKQSGIVTVGTEAAYEPFEYMQDGKIVGYGSDILAYIVNQLGVKLDQKDLPFTGILPGLDAKQFDFVATAVMITPERAQKYGMTVPIADGTVGILKRKGDNSIKTPADIKGKVVGTLQGSAYPKAVKDFEKGTKEIKEYAGFPEAYQDLANGRVDVVVNTNANLSAIVKKQPDTYELVGTFGDKKWISWVTRTQDKELLDYLNSKILEMKASGKLAELQKKWFGYTMETPEKDYLPK
jgi:polar amino acid transport system substrate-binding protein